MRLNISEYARHRGCDPSSVRFALKRGRIKVGEDKLIDATEADRDWERNTNHAQARSGPRSKKVLERIGQNNDKRHRLGMTAKSTDTYADARAMKESLEAQLKELELAEKIGKLIDRVKAEAAIETHFRRLRDAMLNMPIRLAAQVAAVSDARDAHEMLDLAIREILDGFKGVPL